MQVQGNTILITGGGSGIGRGLAEAFHRLDNRVIIAGRDPVKLGQTTAANPGMEAASVDVTDAQSIRRFAVEVAERFPDLNVLVNNAGIMRIENLMSQDQSVVDETVATNLLGPIRLTAALLSQLMDRPRSSVMNVTSALASVPLAASPTYCATKAALHSYSVSLREQLKRTSVEVIELVPPYVQTSLLGEHQSTDPSAVPLAVFIADTLAILSSQPDQGEVIVEQAAPLRFAEARGTFDQVFEHLSEMSRQFAAVEP